MKPNASEAAHRVTWDLSDGAPVSETAAEINELNYSDNAELDENNASQKDIVNSEESIAPTKLLNPLPEFQTPELTSCDNRLKNEKSDLEIPETEPALEKEEILQEEERPKAMEGQDVAESKEDLVEKEETVELGHFPSFSQDLLSPYPVSADDNGSVLSR